MKTFSVGTRGFFGMAVAVTIFFFATNFPLHAAALQPKRFVTRNGMTLLILPQPSLPIVSVQVLVRAGAVLDPEAKAGLANMTASLLEEGTVSRSATEISEAVDFIGADFGASASKDYSTVELRVLKKDIETGFDLLSDVLMHPRFDEKELARVQKQVLGGIQAEQDQPGAIAMRAFQEVVYRSHPYRHAVVGNEVSVPNITRADLVDFHEKYYRPNNTIIAVVGDVTEASAQKIVETYFGPWRPGKTTFPKVEPLPPLQNKVLKRIDKDLTQATVILGHPGIQRANPDYDAVLVMNYILGGGGFSSRLMSDIRDDRGLVYSIYSRFSTHALPGDFSVSFQTKSDSTQEAITAVLQEMAAMQKAPVMEVELAEAKDYLAGSFPLRIDTTDKVATLLTAIEFYGLGLDYFETYAKAIHRVSQADVLRVAKKYLDPAHYALVVVGKQAEINFGSNESGVSGP